LSWLLCVVFVVQHLSGIISGQTVPQIISTRHVYGISARSKRMWKIKLPGYPEGASQAAIPIFYRSGHFFNFFQMLPTIKTKINHILGPR
jgi:hypothetical protein